MRDCSHFLNAMRVSGERRIFMALRAVRSDASGQASGVAGRFRGCPRWRAGNTI
jgi:hypothetical protein